MLVHTARGVDPRVRGEQAEGRFMKKPRPNINGEIMSISAVVVVAMLQFAGERYK